MFALASAALVGAVNVVSKHALDGGADPLPLAAAAYALAALLFLPFTARFRLLKRRDAAPVLASAVLGMVVAPASLFFGLRLTTAVTASLLTNLEALFTAVLAALYLGERVRGREAVPLAAIALGALAVALGPDLAHGALPSAESLWGAALVAVAVLSWSVDSTLTTPLTRRYALRPLTGAKISVGALGLTLLAAGAGNAVPDRAVWPHVAFTAVLGIGASILCLYAAFRVVGATRSIVLFATAAFWGALLGRVFLGEALTWPHLAGGAVMLAGVVALSREAPHALPLTPPPG